MTTNLRSLFVSAGLLLTGIPGSTAPNPAGWEPVVLGSEAKAEAHAEIRARILPGPDGYQVYFKNFGKASVDFGFYVEGLQTVDSVSANGHVYLKPGGFSGPLVIRPESGVEGKIRVQIVECAVSESRTTTSSAS